MSAKTEWRCEVCMEIIFLLAGLVFIAVGVLIILNEAQARHRAAAGADCRFLAREE
jgi:hypothetical protein